MEALPPQAIKDLHRLALRRVTRAVDSVEQLMETEDQRRDLTLNLAHALVGRAASFYAPRDEPPSKAVFQDCVVKVLAVIADAADIETSIREREGTG